MNTTAQTASALAAANELPDVGDWYSTIQAEAHRLYTTDGTAAVYIREISSKKAPTECRNVVCPLPGLCCVTVTRSPRRLSFFLEFPEIDEVTAKPIHLCNCLPSDAKTHKITDIVTAALVHLARK